MIEYELPLSERDAFFATVWKITRLIPSGRVSTYGQIAGWIPAPEGVPPETYQAYRARWVGYAMAACPPDVPWQRVINSQGKISPRRGAEDQRRLLEAEGVTFDQRERVNLDQYGWSGPPDEWLRLNGLLIQGGQLSLF